MIRLDEFLERIYSLSDGTIKPVWIYEDNGGGYPDDPAREIVAAFMSNYKPHVTMSERLCKAEVKEIYWMPDGIAVAVEMEERCSWAVLEEKMEG